MYYQNIMPGYGTMPEHFKLCLNGLFTLKGYNKKHRLSTKKKHASAKWYYHQIPDFIIIVYYPNFFLKKKEKMLSFKKKECYMVWDYA